MNVLLTSVGRRSYLVRYFQEVLAGRGLVVAANCHPESPGMYCADHAIVVPESHSAGYIDAILQICKRFKIGLLCSCHDLDTLALAPYREQLRGAGVTPMLPDADWARICLDKYECGEHLRRAGFDTPWATTSVDEAMVAVQQGKVRLPLIVKARYGFGSLSLSRCESLVDVEAQVRQGVARVRSEAIGEFISVSPDSAMLIQEHMAGAEMCIGLVNDLTGAYAGHIVCEIHSMRAGESDRATTVDPEPLGDLARRLSVLTRHIGIWGVDVLMDNGRPKIIDINPRFSGDYPFHHLAGANVPAALCAWIAGTNFDPSWLKPAVGIAGYKDIVPRRIDQMVSIPPGSCA